MPLKLLDEIKLSRECRECNYETKFNYPEVSSLKEIFCERCGNILNPLTDSDLKNSVLEKLISTLSDYSPLEWSKKIETSKGIVQITVYSAKIDEEHEVLLRELHGACNLNVYLKGGAGDPEYHYHGDKIRELYNIIERKFNEHLRERKDEEKEKLFSNLKRS